MTAALGVVAGETLAIVGRSGSGKTTLLRCLAGLLRPVGGRISLDGAVWYDGDQGINVPPRRRDVAMVFASYALFDGLSAFENAAFGLRAVGGLAPRAVAERALAALTAVEADGLAQRRAGTLSAGESQRVALARALATQPALLLLDEPLSALDVQVRKAVRASLQRSIADLGCATVLVTHEPAEAMLLADRIAVVEEGKIVQTGTLEQLRLRPATSYVASFSGVNIFLGIASPEADGNSSVLVDGVPLIVRGNWRGPVTVVLDEDAVTLAPTLQASSARNQLQGVVESMVPQVGGFAVTLATRPRIVARITAQSASALGITTGTPLHATFKAGEARVF